MIIIELVTTGYVYGAADEITLRTDRDGWEENDIEAKEINDCIWKFELSDDKYLNGFEFKFVLNRKFWSSGNNFIISGKEAKKYHNEHRPHQYHLNDFGFELPTHDVFRIDYVHVNEEYRTLRAEIQRRSQDQQNIVNASLVGFGALLTVLSQIVDSDQLNSGSELYNSLLLIGPWVFLNLGILWCDHDKSIHNIGIYIRDVLENRCFPSITPNLNFPAIVDKNINFYKDIFREEPRKSSIIQKIIQDWSRIAILRIPIVILRIPIAIIQYLCAKKNQLCAILIQFKKIPKVIHLSNLRIKANQVSQNEAQRQNLEVEIKRLINEIEPPKKLNKSEQKKYYKELKSVNLGWQKAHELLRDNGLNKNWILGNIFPIIYFLLPSLLLISVYSIINIVVPVLETVKIHSFYSFYNTYFSSSSKVGVFFKNSLEYLLDPSFLLQWIVFIIDLYLMYVFLTYWRQSIQTKKRKFLIVFGNENL